jgi:epoxyqueuosine reductase
MQENLVDEIKSYLLTRGIPVIGAADAETLNRTAPEGFRPSDYLPGAKTMLVLGHPLPLSVFTVPNDRAYTSYTRAYMTAYALINEVASFICLKMESGGYPSMPIPSYSPIKFHDGEPWGILSFKHAAAAAGLGKIGKNTLLIHPQYGNVLRFGGVLTAMPWPSGTPQEFEKLCPAGCKLCLEACPVGALRDGTIDKTACMTYCVNHVLMPPRFIMRILRPLMRKSNGFSRFISLFTFNFFEEYGIRCVQCLLACPYFPEFSGQVKK